VRCWWCGVAPTEVLEITQLGDAEPRYWPNWPAGDHDHAARPPSPGELLAAGAARFDRIVRIAAE
jgi:hypothetical protein